MGQNETAQKTERAQSNRTGNEGNAPRILVAEDHDEMRSLLVWALRRNGYEVTECADGTTLCDYLNLPQPQFAGKAGHRYFDLIISDIRMPGITGLEVLESIRQSVEKLPPVILITAFGDKETHAKAHRLGAVAVFDKPFEIDDLICKVRTIMQHRRFPRN